MLDYKIIVDKLNEALFFVSEELSENQINFIRSDINAGEWRLAFETLCDILSEENLRMNPRVYKLVQEIGYGLNIDSETWESLKVQVAC
ncbi:MafI family immunity protein [Planktothrix sp. FACHB-1355]|uniref:MafI family immunity protein n=1 Tax=Aerosakkonema funiforme FACHB-1375 TaxID=2949571 RepID=A0A926VA79_9CYAN|nr:MafI family immunity protein [Aerosakkonema funiforme FACHB-1375]MBD3557783.1 MafI family immunity protein [Planktothrix sp. FACHB-1355]